jgi:hypothetical protein
MSPLTNAIWMLSIALETFVLARLLWLQLWGPYRCLFSFLLVDLISTVALGNIRAHSNVYALTYMAAQIVCLAIAANLVRNIYRRAMGDYQALATFGAKAASGVIVSVAILSAAFIGLNMRVMPGRSQVLHWFFSFEQVMNVAIVLMLLLITAFVLWFPVNVKKNVVIYILGAAVYFLSRVVGLLAANSVSAKQLDTISACMISVAAACYLLWGLGFQPEGASAPVVTARWNPATAAHLNSQLAAINTALGRLGRP